MKYVYFVRGKVHAALAEVSIRSVLRADSGALPVVYTDEDSAALGECLNDLARIVQFDSRGAPMMVANLDAQCRAIAAAAERLENRIEIGPGRQCGQRRRQCVRDVVRHGTPK